MVWKYICHIPLPYMDDTELSGYSDNKTLSVNSIL